MSYSRASVPVPSSRRSSSFARWAVFGGLTLTASCDDGARIAAPREVSSPTASAVTREPTTRWSDPASWPGRRVPSDGEAVVIAAGRTIVLDTISAALASLRIDGALVLDGTRVELRSHSILVTGALRAGTERSPIVGAVAITLLGATESADQDGMSAKALIVAGGRLDLHGSRAPAWTRLSATANAGADRIALERDPQWHVGDRLVVASTDYDPAHAEERTITRIDGASVHLDRPLAYTHWGTMQRFGGRRLDERAEVGRLSRNVVVRGDSASERGGVGGHLMILPGSTVHISDVELHRMGQRGRTARYPIHWHLARDAAGSYVRRTAVWRSYNRCITIHGTDAVRLEDNVCYDHAGHGFFFEDGVEERNVLAGNLGLRTRRPSPAARLLASDERAATFWVTNPNNVLRDNVAAGSEGFGIWYALPEHPGGLSATTRVWPRRIPLGTFDGNRAHSNIQSGLWVDEGANSAGASEVTVYAPSAVDGAPAPAVFRGFVGYKNRQFGAWLRGRALRLTGATLGDNMVGAAFAASDASLDDALVVGRSANAERNPDAWSPTHGFWFYDGRVGVRHTTFASFVSTPTDAARALAFFPSNPWPIDATNYVSGLEFVNAERVALERPSPAFDGTKSAVIVDEDGTLSGTVGARVVPNTPFLVDSSCIVRAEWMAAVCATRMVQLRFHVGEGTLGRVVVGRDDGASVDVGPIAYDRTTASLTVPVGRPLEVTADVAPRRPISVAAVGLADGDVLDVLLPYAAAPSRVVRVGGSDGGSTVVPIVAAAVAAQCRDCASYDASQGRLRVRLARLRGVDPAVIVVP